MKQRILLVVATTVLLILGFLSLGSYMAWFWPIELFAHFRLQYLVLSLIVTIILGILGKTRHLKSKVIVIFALLLVGLNLIEVLPWYLPHAQQLTGNTSQQVRLLSFNINIQNQDNANIINVVQENRPDIALLMEVTPNTFDNLTAELKNTLPYTFRSPGGGLAIFSRLPIKDIKADNFNGKSGHNLIATLTLNKKPIQLIGSHPIVPVKRNTFHRRNLQLAALSDYIHDFNQPLIIMGDFNVTPWSPYYRRFINKTNLHNTRLGFGILPSWPRSATHVNLPSWVIPLINIPIDHCFVSKHFRVSGIYTGKNANSDHAPLITDLVLN
ncbi:endonuclease/exonuclease/phosphatase family protein [Tolypothrix sp. FACHB-123]|uniref:endonuclease/exonuclease/phosphatase family protein n=1 Tax=Tolypothrix sp. FACHB-123 TaxID=2692868 RepID=UPI001684CCB1|nr:endonuclease/exonuclease/phosphatase family protein [Tolypothrix sp. FACHB-123]MBD2358809.1 endonuclease/exonuclease/phosphatase family protein [Tolypothrix sp. FACHB-123]